MRDINEVGLNKLCQWCYDTDYEQFVKDMGFEHFTDDYSHGKFKDKQNCLSAFIGSLSKKYAGNLAEAINNKETR